MRITNIDDADWEDFNHKIGKANLLEIKKIVKPLTYNKIENLYIKFKDKIDIFTKTIRED